MEIISKTRERESKNANPYTKKGLQRKRAYEKKNIKIMNVCKVRMK